MNSRKIKSICEVYSELPRNRMLDVSDYDNGKFKTIPYIKTDKSAKKHVSGISLVSSTVESYKKALEDLGFENIDYVLAAFNSKLK